MSKVAEPTSCSKSDQFLRKQEIVGKTLLRVIVPIGFCTVAFYLYWWVRQFTQGNVFALIALFIAIPYLFVQVVPSWLIYLRARHRTDSPSWNPDLSVDVFVTAYHEPVEMVEACLSAAYAMRGAHKTYLLDDGCDPVLAALASQYGAGYLTRTERKHAKAGNINSALPRTNGDIIAVFDIDHVPTADYLEKTVGYFHDAKIGFVQVMLTFRNGCESWVAQAAAETTFDFYNPTSLGMDTMDCVTMMGSNSLIRRSALNRIGGYQPGLAEDLATSLALHADGWNSAYVAEPLAPGLTPASIASWFTQQIKWARGVFEVLLGAYPRLFRCLSPAEHLCYGVRMTKYWIGLVISTHLIAALVVLIGGNTAAQESFNQYLIPLALVAFFDVLIRSVATATWRHPSLTSTTLFRAISLIYFSWPLYTLAWIMAVLRVPLAFRPTPKDSGGGLKLPWVIPQFLTVVLLIGAVCVRWFLAPTVWNIAFLLAFAVAQAAIQVMVLVPQQLPVRGVGQKIRQGFRRARAIE